MPPSNLKDKQALPPLTSPEDLVRAIVTGHIVNADQLQKAKVALAKVEQGAAFHSNSDLLALGRKLGRRGELIMEDEEARGPDAEGDIEAANEAALRRLEQVLRRKPMRTLAGVAPVAVMTSPEACPHGTCVYCPGGVEAAPSPMAVAGAWEQKGTPQSYTGHEPAARRGAMYDYDACDQAQARLGQYVANGHPVDKIDLIVMGGTFTARPIDYQLQFITNAFKGLNEGPLKEERRERTMDAGEAGSVAALPRREEATGTGAPDTWLSSQASLNAIAGWQELRAAHAANETARSRCIGMTLETRPDQCSPQQVARMVKMGATRVELGVQVLDDKVLKAVGRAHTVEDIAQATASLKAAGLKVCYHLMPGLPGMTPETDLAAFKLLWDDQRFRPDLLKLYPCLVVGGSALAKQWEVGRFQPYDNETAVRVVSQMKSLVPSYVRIQRIQRDIPVHQILAGVTAGNLRQLARDRLNEESKTCDCIRCAEAGLKGLSTNGSPSSSEATNVNRLKDELELKASLIKYQANQGTENFLTLRELPGTLHGYCRLRLDEINATVRELKVVGQTIPLETKGSSANKELQHQGLGQRLMKAAEQQAKKEGYSKLRVTAGVGVRPYYRRLGYTFERGYMVKEL